MGSIVDTRLQLAAVTLAEELNFTRAAERLRITQPALSKQVLELERWLGFCVFSRGHNRVDITEAGQVFIRGCRLSMAQLESAIHSARGVNNGSDHILTIGNTPHVDSNLVSTALSIDLPLYPKLKVRFESMFTLDLIHSLLAEEIEIALVTDPPHSSKLTLIALSNDPIFIVMPSTHVLANKRTLKIEDIMNTGWILPSKRVHPRLCDSIIERSRAVNVHAGDIHHVMTAREALHLVKERVGIALLPKDDALHRSDKDLSIIPLAEETLTLRTYLALRGDESSRLINEFGRAFLKKCAHFSTALQQPKQLPLLL